MAQMITDSFLKYNNSEFGGAGASSQNYNSSSNSTTNTNSKVKSNGVGGGGGGGGGGSGSLVASSLNGLGKYYSSNNNNNNNNNDNKSNSNNSNNYHPSMSNNNNNNNNNKYGDSLSSSLNNFSLNYLDQAANYKRKFDSDEVILETLRGNNYKQQLEIFDDLSSRALNNIEGLLSFKTVDELHNSLGLLLINTLSNEVQHSCLKFLQTYFKSIKKLKSSLSSSASSSSRSKQLNDKLNQVDSNICDVIIPCLITSSVSTKLQLKQVSIDLIYSYMRLTGDHEKLFARFVKYGVENSDYLVCKSFMDPTLCILITDEFQHLDFTILVRSLVRQLSIGANESYALKCLSKIEQVVKPEKFFSIYVSKLPSDLKNVYLSFKNNNNNSSSSKMNGGENNMKSNRSSINNNSNSSNNSLLYDDSMKFNLIPNGILQKLSGEDEIQRLQAIRQLENKLTSLSDISVMNPYHQDFISFMSKFVDDSNYEIRVSSIKIVYLFVEKLNAIHINQCYRAICNCARQVMSQTHQSKTIKQYLNSMLLFTIDKMKNAIVILECLLDKIKDRNAKAREECLNVIIAALLKFPSEKFDPLKKIFFQIAPLICDIKRNVRHAVLECISILFYRIKQVDRNAGSSSNLVNQLDHIPSFHNSENINVIKDVINYRLSRNKLPVLNPDMTIEYGVKIPPSNAPMLMNGGGYGGNNAELDIEWIVSASSSSSTASSSASLSNMSSARSQKSVFSEMSGSNPIVATSHHHHQMMMTNNVNNNHNNNGGGGGGMHRMINLNDNSAMLSISTGSFKQRRPSGTKQRLPWEVADLNGMNNNNAAAAGDLTTNNNLMNTPKTNHRTSREVAPLKAFPLSDDPAADFLNNAVYSNNGNNNGMSSSKSKSGGAYPSSTSYQEKYLKKIQNDKLLHHSKTDSNLDLSAEIPEKVKRIQSEKAYSLDNLYNIDDNINSESSIQKRKYANLNLKNGMIPSKPLIPRRNSATKSSIQQNNDDEFLKNLNADYDTFNSELKSFFSTSADYSSTASTNGKKYDTMPNMRAMSAKNRKRIEKLFSLNSHNNNNNNNNNNGSSSNNKSNDINNTSRYTPSNTESGIYSMSDYDNNHHNGGGGGNGVNDYYSSNNNNNSYLQSTNLGTKKQSLNNQRNGGGLLINQSIANGVNNQTLNGGSLINNSNNNNNNNSSNLNGGSISFKPAYSSDVEIIGVKLGNNNNNNNNNNSSSSNTQDNTTNSIHNITKKKIAIRNPGEGAANPLSDNNNNDNDILDIVGKGYNHSNADASAAYQQDQQDIIIRTNNNYNYNKYNNNNSNGGLFTENNNNNNYPSSSSDYVPSNPEEMSFPLSLSFRSRIRQKTQEKIEEKQKRRVERMKKAAKIQKEQQQQQDSLNSSTNTCSPLPGDSSASVPIIKNFGLSISGYQTTNTGGAQVANGKPPIYNNGISQQQQQQQQNHHQQQSSSSGNNKSNGEPADNYFYLDDEYEPNDLIEDELLNSNHNNNSRFAVDTYIGGGVGGNVNSILPSYDTPTNSNKPKFKPTLATQARIKARAAAAAEASAKQNREDKENSGGYGATAEENNDTMTTTATMNGNSHNNSSGNNSASNYGAVREDFLRQPFKSPEGALKEAMNLLAQEDWEKKCHGMNIIRRLCAYHEDVVISNIHAIVLALVQEVKNLRSQVSRFALMAFADLFANLKRNMDVDIDIAVKTILSKNGETNDFIRADVEKCLDKMVNNVTTNKGLIALINGGATHRNPLIRRTTAQYVFKCCEIMGPGKILSGIKDVTEKILVTASQFVVDGPPDIRWYGRKIFHMLMSHDEFDRLLVRYLNESTRKNIKEILDSIRVKGPGDVPTESARNARKAIARNNSDQMSRSAGTNLHHAASLSRLNDRTNNEFAATTAPLPPQPHPRSTQHQQHAPRMDAEAQEQVRTICTQLRNPDFRERIEAIEKFQILCETEPDVANANLVQIFDKFNPCLTDSNSKVNYRALNTMHQVTPILGDNLSAVIANVVPLIAQNLASKNSEIQDMASNILDVFIEYLDGGVLIQPFANIAQHGNARIRPQIIYKLADLMPHVYQRKQKQVELHVLPLLWLLLNTVKGGNSSSTTNGSSSLNVAVTKLVQSVYEQMGEYLIDKASNSSSVSARNLELLKDLITTPI